MKRLEVVIESNLCAFVKGHGSRKLLTELRGRAPVWSSMSRAWVTTAETAADVVAVAERRGWQVIVSEADPETVHGGEQLPTGQPLAQSDAGQLW